MLSYLLLAATVVLVAGFCLGWGLRGGENAALSAQRARRLRVAPDVAGDDPPIAEHRVAAIATRTDRRAR